MIVRDKTPEVEAYLADAHSRTTWGQWEALGAELRVLGDEISKAVEGLLARLAGRRP